MGLDFQGGLRAVKSAESPAENEDFARAYSILFIVHNRTDLDPLGPEPRLRGASKKGDLGYVPEIRIFCIRGWDAGTLAAATGGT